MKYEKTTTIYISNRYTFHLNPASESGSLIHPEVGDVPWSLLIGDDAGQEYLLHSRQLQHIFVFTAACLSRPGVYRDFN